MKNAVIAATLWAIALASGFVASRADAAELPVWLSGSYTGVLAGFPTPCIAGLDKTREEAILFNVAVAAGTVTISFTSPFANVYSYVAPVVRDGADIVMNGRYETQSRLGKGRLAGRLVISDHAVVFTHDIAQDTQPDCLAHAVIIGVRQIIP